MNLFLLSYIPPSNNDVTFYSLQEGTDNVKIENSIEKYIDVDSTIISFDFFRIVNFQVDTNEKSGKIIRLSNVINLEDITKQLTGLPLNAYVNLDKNPPWNIWEQLKDFYPQNLIDLNLAQDIYYGITKVNIEKRNELFIQIVRFLEKLFAKLEAELEAKCEYDRYYDIEKPVNEILLKVAYRCLHINPKQLAVYLNEIHKELYGIRNKLQLQYSIFSPNDFKHISRELRKEGLDDIANHFYVDEQYYRLLKISRDKSIVAKLLYEEMRLSRNYNVLLRFGKLEDIPVIPIFQSFGTITSRILVTSPSIQQLSKKFRNIIKAEKGKVLVYIDYIQFEAGILASKCADVALIEGYSRDIYMALSKNVFESEDYRDLCKVIFYKYIYGAEMEKMIDFLNDHFKQDAEKYKLKIEMFFEKFEKFRIFREEKNQQLNENGRIGTSNGNYRTKTIEEKETKKDVSWTLSQVIQGEASLILKKAILEVTAADKDIDFLIPMHDAALFQVPIAQELEKKDVIKKIFRKVFLEHCPEIDKEAEIARFKQFWE